MKKITFPRQGLRRLFFGFGMAGIIVGTQAAPTHQLTSTFEAKVGGQVASLPVGTEVEVVSDDGKMAMVRHALPGGATTLDDKSVDGRILRLEKRRVFVLNNSGEAEDVLLKELDKDSRSVMEKWRFQNQGKSPEADPRVKLGNQFSLVFPELGASQSADPAKIQIRIPENYQPDKRVPLALYFGGGGGTGNYDALKGLVDSSGWVLVAFSYPKDVSTSLHAYDEGKSGELIVVSRADAGACAGSVAQHQHRPHAPGGGWNQ